MVLVMMQSNDAAERFRKRQYPGSVLAVERAADVGCKSLALEAVIEPRRRWTRKEAFPLTSWLSGTPDFAGASSGEDARAVAVSTWKQAGKQCTRRRRKGLS